jgi:membrane-associated phospholipid phosphatase
LNFVEGVKVNAFDSFPSGHTTSAFVLAFIVILLLKNPYMKALVFIMAVLIGFSRVYLLQHFLIDIYIGSVFGILSVLIAWKIMLPYTGREQLERGLLKR